MARIVDNPHGGRRMIRLTCDDILMVMSQVQRASRDGQAATPETIQAMLAQQPVYLPEEL